MELSAIMEVNAYQGTVSMENAVLASNVARLIFITLTDARECHAIIGYNADLETAIKMFALKPRLNV
jgi:hypothetical protein